MKPADFQNAPFRELLKEATRQRRRCFGDRIDLCSVVNIKNGHCPMDCRFCAQSRHNQSGTAVYPLLNARRLWSDACKAWKNGVRRVGLVASGCALSKPELSMLIEAVQGLSENGNLCASLGQLPADSLAELKQAGFTRYHHNLETSERYYPQICTTQQWRDRRATVLRAKELGLEACSGGLFGLGETWQDRFDLARTLGEMGVDSVPINFFKAIPGTPLENQPALTAEEALRIVALFRILLPETSIRICGGRPSILGTRQQELFDAGADALMTGNYLTTTGFSVDADWEMIGRLGLRVRKDEPNAPPKNEPGIKRP